MIQLLKTEVPQMLHLLARGFAPLTGKLWKFLKSITYRERPRRETISTDLRRAGAHPVVEVGRAESASIRKECRNTFLEYLSGLLPAPITETTVLCRKRHQNKAAAYAANAVMPR